MNTATAIEGMIRFYEGARRDINHFLKVYAFAKAIGELEGLDTREQRILEVAAIVHDIPCPLCRRKYGSADGKKQEIEGPALAKDFLEELGFEPELVERVCWLVGHHHTYTDVESMDHQILLEADFLVNAHEHQMPMSAIENMEKTVFQTQAGKRMLAQMYLKA